MMYSKLVHSRNGIQEVFGICNGPISLTFTVLDVATEFSSPEMDRHRLQQMHSHTLYTHVELQSIVQY